MKITVKDYLWMEQRMRPYHSAQLLAEYRRLGLSEKRYRWDVARQAGLIGFFCDTVYQYADDSHIDTALRKITGTKNS